MKIKQQKKILLKIQGMKIKLKILVRLYKII